MSDVDRYAVVGYPVSHSQSPAIHRMFAAQTGQNLVYELLEAKPEEFEIAVRGFQAAGGKGVNVTVPHKERALQLATSASAAAQRAQAANTLDFRHGSITAHNTDGSGLLRDLTDNLQLELTDKRVLILGAGGAARGIIGPLLEAGIGELTVANRTPERARKLREALGTECEFAIREFAHLGSLEPQDLVINATSAGVRSESIPFPAALFTAQTTCYDLSYSLNETPFVELARQSGAAAAVQGWGMLIEQAADSFEIWRGVRPDTTEILARMRR